MERPDQTRDREDEAPDGREPDLQLHERMHAGSGPTPPDARIIHEIIREDGERALKRSVKAMAWSGFGAGLSMGFSFFVMAVIRSALPDEPWRILIAGFGYTVGFLIVVLGRQQLFTESTLTAVLPFLTRLGLDEFLPDVAALDRGLPHPILPGTMIFAFLISHTGRSFMIPSIKRWRRSPARPCPTRFGPC